MRFHPKFLTYHHPRVRSLSILFMRFNQPFPTIILRVQIFQFSLWDSNCKILFWHSRTRTFNSLYEIPKYKITVWTVSAVAFQFSLWDSYKFTGQSSKKGRAFNSLYEILPTNQIFSIFGTKLSILFMRFFLKLNLQDNQSLSFNSLYEIPWPVYQAMA